MLFNSFEFLLFFPVVTILFFLIPHRWKWLHLLISSCIFYMAFIPVYILILVFTIIIDYCAGILIEKSENRRRKLFLLLSIIANVGILAVFKYYNFFVSNINELFGLPAHSSLRYLNIILPIGLSFHTFQAMSYTIEVYRGNQKAERHFGIYALYVMFYPQLVAGPIERPQNLLWQFRVKHEYEIQRIYEGLKLMLWGLFKKVVIADRLALYVNEVYNNQKEYDGSNLALATCFFAIQIYCDFSGYSDMAIGSAKVMGFKLMTNFNRPYFARNIQEFWKRWHISLSTWFRDYVYISLGGNRVSKWRVYLNVAIVFVLSGFWHGASWNFILWGSIHAMLIIMYMLYKEYIAPGNGLRSRVWNTISAILTFFFVCIGWIFFRAANTKEAMEILTKIFNGKWTPFYLKHTAGDVQFGISALVLSLIVILIMFLNEKWQDVQQTLLNRKPAADILFNAGQLFFSYFFRRISKNKLYLLPVLNNAYLKILCSLFIAVVAVFIFSSFLEKGNLKYHSHKFKRVHEIFSGSYPYDVVYIGSSRIHNAVNPRVVDSITGLKSYNAGVEGGTMFEFKMTLDGYLVHHHAPRILFLSVDAKSFDIKRNIFYPPQYFLEMDNPVVYSALGFKHTCEPFLVKHSSTSRLLYYDDYTKALALSGLIGKNEMQPLHAFEYNGFLSNGNQCVDSSSGIVYPALKFEFQQNAIRYLQDIIDTCKKKDITLLLLYSPEYRFGYQQSVTNFSAFSHLLNSMAGKNNVSLFHDDSLKLCADARNFANPTHLNTQGSTAYSCEIANRLKILVKTLKEK